MPTYGPWEYLDTEDYEELGDGWVRATLPCPSCREDGMLVLELLLGENEDEDEPREAEAMRLKNKSCAKCGINFRTDLQEQ